MVRNYASITITIIGNITVLVSYSVICFGYFMPISHGVNTKAPPIASPPPLPLTKFSPGLFVVLQAILHQPFFALIRSLQKRMHFQSKTNFSFNLLLQPPTKYLRKTLVFMWNSVLREKFDFYFQGVFLLVLTKFSFWEEDWAIGYNSMEFWHYSELS